MNFLATIYLEANLEENGLGISAEDLTIVAFLAYFPSLFLLLVSPLYVPSKISYKTFISFVLILYAFSLLMLPIFKNLVNVGNFSWMKYIILLN